VEERPIEWGIVILPIVLIYITLQYEAVSSLPTYHASLASLEKNGAASSWSDGCTAENELAMGPKHH
jgi:hypothetical protein